ncbi:unnamed protein product [Toxocara canis]|uniref:Acyl-CoA dehydrogenase n=1 Tax=Toxocara canis TaxID=6265 RepID=A0A183VB82_TOXCA|nr:unnamed protein product [Toxocara canis]
MILAEVVGEVCTTFPGAFSTAEPETEYREEMPADERHYFPQMRWQRPAMLPYEIESADRLKKWASQLRFGKRASWASKVRFG